MRKAWIYFINTFEVNTRKSMKKMLQLINDHLARLHAVILEDAEIKLIFDRTEPEAIIFQNLMTQRKVGKGSGKGKTNSLTNLLRLLSKTWINDWETDTFYHYKDYTPEGISIFPNGRTPFQKGSQEERILAVGALAEAMLPYDVLEPIRLDVLDKHAQLKTAQAAQKAQFERSGQISDDLEAQRLKLADIMYGNLGLLMNKYRSVPTNAERFFNMTLLRRSMPDSDLVFQTSGTVNAGATAVVFLPKKMELNIQSPCTFTNTSDDVRLEFFFAEHASAVDASIKIAAEPGEMIEINAAGAGWSPEKRILIVKNTGALTAAYEVLVEEEVEEEG